MAAFRWLLFQVARRWAMVAFSLTARDVRHRPKNPHATKPTSAGPAMASHTSKPTTGAASAKDSRMPRPPTLRVPSLAMSSW